MTKVSRVKSFAICWVYQVGGEKFRDRHLHTFMVFQLYKTAMSIAMKLCVPASRKFSLKLSLEYLEVDKSTLLTHVCTDFTQSTTGGKELQLK